MNIKIAKIKISQKEIVRNLLEKYLYEFSQYRESDTNELGLYGFPYLDNYWTENNRWPYFIKFNNKIIGFVFINDYPEVNLETDYTMSEFFIIYKYRKQGIGKYCVNYLFKKHKGKWQVTFHPKNKISKSFWINVIKEYTKGKYKIYKDLEEVKFEDGTIGYVIVFNT
jgi:predicted acetyltransferase